MIQLGFTYKDSITGFEGVAVARAIYLYGCARVELESRKGKAKWFDEQRLTYVASGLELVAAAEGSAGGPQDEPTRHADPG